MIQRTVIDCFIQVVSSTSLRIIVPSIPRALGGREVTRESYKAIWASHSVASCALLLTTFPAVTNYSFIAVKLRFAISCLMSSSFLSVLRDALAFIFRKG